MRRNYIIVQYVLTILHCSINSSVASRILGIFPVQSKSHFAMHRKLMENLASRGHSVTVFSYFEEPTDNSNYTAIYIGSLSSNVYSFVDNVTLEGTTNFTGLSHYVKYLWRPLEDEDICDSVYSHRYTRDLLSGKTEPPDLIINEFYHVPCFCSLAEKFDVPVIAIVPPSHVMGVDYTVGNPLHPAYWPLLATDYSQTMTFYQRLINWFHYISIYGLHYLRTVNTLLEIDKKYVGNSEVTVEKLERRISLVIYNNHFSFLNRPSVPNAIEIGGGLIDEAKPLPSEIKQFVEEAEDGVIFFSFGTTLKFSSIPEEKINMFKRAFSEIPQRVLWRSDLDNLTDVPSNVMIKKWYPQRDLLEHENVKAFVSHGGLFGSFEAIHTGTPIIGIPFFYDQFSNVRILQSKGVAIALNYDDLTYETLLKALKDIVNDPGYQTNMQKLSAILKDRPMPALDTAMYWIEYVIRHKGATHLRVASADMPLYKFLLLDVVVFILLSTLIICWIVFRVIDKIIRYCWKHNARKTIKIE